VGQAPRRVEKVLALGRHTPLDVALGTIAGVAAGTAIHYV